MRSQCLEALSIKPEGLYVDATLGLGGHSALIARKLGSGRLVAIDRDETALHRAQVKLAPFMEKVTLAKGNFAELKAILSGLGIEKIDGVLFDFGVSSPQLDDPARGFSYMADSKLDMRMDAEERLTAAEIVNSWDYEALKKIFYEYGEERYAPRVANAIINARREGVIMTTGQLVEIIKSAMPASALREKQHPAKRVFQALRIAVNGELDAISCALEQVPELLKPGGRLCAISFHSLEDRIVKQSIARFEKGCTCPRDLPVCVCGFKQTLRSVSRKPILPTAEEIEENPRSRSAKLRVAERV
jgi:16S rRNA (cytosine1402-N4)-methyltransferase